MGWCHDRPESYSLDKISTFSASIRNGYPFSTPLTLHFSILCVISLMVKMWLQIGQMNKSFLVFLQCDFL